MSAITATSQTLTHALSRHVPATRPRQPDGDTPAQEAAESQATKAAELQGDGKVSPSATSVDIKV